MRCRVLPGQSVFKWADGKYYGPGDVVDLSNLGPKMLQQFISRGVVEPLPEPERKRGDKNQPEDNEQ